MKRIQRRSRARRDIVEIAEYVAHDDPAAADQFLDACESTFARLAGAAMLGRPRSNLHPRLRGVRSIQIDGFPAFLVFYLPSRSEILILRVLDGRRDLGLLLSEL